jgi:uncharacterized protein (DUF2237 family)
MSASGSILRSGSKPKRSVSFEYLPTTYGAAPARDAPTAATFARASSSSSSAPSSTSSVASTTRAHHHASSVGRALTLVLGAVALLGAFVALATHHHTANAHARGAGEGVVALSAASAARLGVENDASSGSKNLLGGPLRPCSDATQATQTGIDRSGSCAWDPDDAGYHAVCVKMDAKFLSASATRDANDLSSVVKPGERWCVCAWAFASAVERDPKTMEGLELQCDGSNGKLRGVYESFIARKEALKSPSGREYEAGKALAAVDRLCPAPR